MSAHQVMSPQSCDNPNFKNFRTPTWEFRDKMTFECWPHGQAYYKGEGGGFSQI